MTSGSRTRWIGTKETSSCPKEKRNSKSLHLAFKTRSVRDIVKMVSSNLEDTQMIKQCYWTSLFVIQKKIIRGGLMASLIKWILKGNKFVTFPLPIGFFSQ